MTDHPILFSAPMVRALLDGSKTQTRRTVKTETVMGHESFVAPRRKGYAHVYLMHRDFDLKNMIVECPYGQPGDQLWVRETCFINDYRGVDVPEDERADCQVVYKADPLPDWEGEQDLITWRPSIHMPRWASRITLEITGVRVERLQDISKADATAEGASGHPDGPWHAYRSLWTLINGAESWSANPWVWVVEFKVLKP